MNTDHTTEFARRLMALAELFDVKLSPARTALYFEALRDLPLEAVITAMNTAAKGCKFFPRPVELREFALGDREDVTEQAWLLFRQAVQRAGAYASLAIEEAALAETIVAVFGAWPAACGAEFTPEMWASKRKEFGRVYRVMRGRALSGGRYLTGLCEQANGGRKDYQRYVPVHYLGRTAIRELAAADAEAARTQLAVEAHAFSRLDAEGMVGKLLSSQTDGAA